MLWSDIKERAKLLTLHRGTLLIGQLISLWAEESPGLDKPLKDKDLGRDRLVRDLAALEYDPRLDRPVHEAIRALPAPVTADAAVGVVLSRFPTHPAAQTLSSLFGCSPSEVISRLQLQSEALVAGASPDATHCPTLARLSVDLTERARRGDYADLVPGEATTALERALTKVRRGSVMLTGPSGSGKTTAVAAMALRVATGLVHPKLRNVRIIEVSVGALVAGTQYRGQFSERVEALLKEVGEQRGTIILFIDEAHTILGAGRVNNDSYDLGNALKTALADNRIRLICATTDAEYQRYVARDPAFSRRFERIRIRPVSGDALDTVLRKQVNGLEARHDVLIPEPVWREARRLSDRYLENRSSQPDRTLDLLDSSAPLAPQAGSLTIGHLRVALSGTTGLPIDLIEQGLRSRLDAAQDALHRTVRGQERVVEAILNRLRSNPLRYRADARPLGSFMLQGPSGTGKTLIPETLNAALFGARDTLLHIHGGEFAEGGIAKLTGFPAPGLDTHHGATEGGVLCDHLRDHPMGVIVFDEIEKAHPSLHEPLLGILDKGEFQAGNGTTWHLRNHVVFCTSNALTAQDLQGTGIGFGGRGRCAFSREAITEKLCQFRRELLNRFDDILVLDPLSHESRLAILKQRIATACDAARAAGLPEPSTEALEALLARHKAAIDLAGGRAIERCAADEVILPLQRALCERAAVVRQQASAPRLRVKSTPAAIQEPVHVL